MKPYLLSFMFMYPAISHAAGSVSEVQQVILDVITRLGYLFLAAAVAFFVYGVVKFIANADDTSEREKGKQFIAWAIISFVVLVSIWALAAILLDTFGISIGGTPSFVRD